MNGEIPFLTGDEWAKLELRNFREVMSVLRRNVERARHILPLLVLSMWD